MCMEQSFNFFLILRVFSSTLFVYMFFFFKLYVHLIDFKEFYMFFLCRCMKLFMLIVNFYYDFEYILDLCKRVYVKKLNSNLPQADESLYNFVEGNILRSFNFRNVDENEVSGIILKLKNTRCEINHIPVKLLKINCKHITYPISKLVNVSSKLREFPATFKTTRVTPIRKKASSENVANFKPISCLPYTSNIFEIHRTLFSIRLLIFQNFSSDSKRKNPLLMLWFTLEKLFIIH